MEQEFRTTFIPKKPVTVAAVNPTGPVSRPVGILFVISVVLFVATGVVVGGVYAYRSILTNDVANLKSSLDTVQRGIETNVIKEFTVADKRLRNAQTLLSQHTVLAPVFSVLGTTTLPSIRYTKMDVSFDDSKNLVATLSGESDGYRSIALQSQALSDRTNIKDIIFSNFVVTPKGNVSFDMSFMIPAADLSFSKFVADAATNTQTDTSNTPPVDSGTTVSDGTATTNTTPTASTTQSPGATVTSQTN